MDNMNFLSEVLEDFCNKHDLPFMSADDILYSSTLDGEVELNEYQKDWLRNFIDVWDRTEQNSIHVEIPSYQHEDIVRQLDDAIDVCGRATSYDDHPDHTKTYPFASGYAKSAMREVKERLQRYG